MPVFVYGGGTPAEYKFPDGTSFDWGDVKFGDIDITPVGMGTFPKESKAFNVIPLIIRFNGADYISSGMASCTLNGANNLQIFRIGSNSGAIYFDCCIFEKATSLSQLSTSTKVKFDFENVKENQLKIIAWLEK